MNKVLLIILATLSGCSVVPVKQTFPEAPKELLQECPPLRKVEGGNPQIKEFLEVVVDNYGRYHGCAAVHSAFIEWYKKQKSVFDSSGN